MQHNIIVHNEPRVIDIKPATYNDIGALIVLNSKWQLANLNGNVDQGFVGAAFNADFYRTLIDRNEVIVAYDKGVLAVYMLTVNHTNVGLLSLHQEQAQLLKQNGTIPANASVAVGIQTAVDINYHGTGLISIVRNEFKDYVRDRFQYFFTTISKSNQRSFASAIKFGWQLVGDNEAYHFLILVV